MEIRKFFKKVKRDKENHKIEVDNLENRKRKEEIIGCIVQEDFSELGIDMQLIEEIFYRGLEAGIIKILPSADGGVKISITNLQIETFPIKIEKKDLLKYFFYDEK